MGDKKGVDQNATNGFNGLDQKDENERSDLVIGLGAVAAMAVVGFAAWDLGKVLFGSGSSDAFYKKTMKAPGRDYRIFRDDFENNPCAYFRDLRKN